MVSTHKFCSTNITSVWNGTTDYNFIAMEILQHYSAESSVPWYCTCMHDIIQYLVNTYSMDTM